MWILIIGLGWIWLRSRQGKPILPEWLGGAKNPFGSKPAILVPTPNGIVAIPADTPAVHPAIAAAEGMLSPSATMNLAQALKRAEIDISASAGSLGGAWAMFDPRAGAGGDVFVDELGMPRSNSKISRRWGVR